MNEAELLMPLLDGVYTKSIYANASGYHGKSLAFDVKNEGVLYDMKKLIELRAASR